MAGTSKLDALKGIQIGPYTLGQMLGKGGMGVVYFAKDERLKRPAAIKFLSPRFADRPDLRGRFLREVRTVASLSHPNIAAAYGAGEEGDLVWFAMEFVEGQELSKLIRERSLTQEQALKLSIQLTEALAYAHSFNIIHRDLKPGNVRITPNDQVKVLDFGLAKSVSPIEDDEDEDEDQITLLNTKVGAMLGTPGYMSPEQARGEPDIDVRTDVFALGVMLYQMLVGQRPFRGKTPMDRNAAVLHFDPIRPKQIITDFPDPLERIIWRCLRKDRVQRYPNAAALRDDLQRYVQGDVVQAPPLEGQPPLATLAASEAKTTEMSALPFENIDVVSPGALPDSPVPTASEEERSSSPKRTKHRPRIIPFAALGLGLVGLFAVGWIAWSTPSTETPTNANVIDVTPTEGSPSPTIRQNPAVAETQLTDTPSDNVVRALDVSTNAQRIVALDGSGLWIRDFDGSQDSRLNIPLPPNLRAIDVAFLSPNEIFVYGKNEASLGELWVIGPARESERLQHGTFDGAWPSPDGRSVAFVSQNTLRVSALRSTTGSTALITLNPRERITALAWSNDNQSMSFVRTTLGDVDASLQTVRVDGSASRTLLTDPNLALPGARAALVYQQDHLLVARSIREGRDTEIVALALTPGAQPVFQHRLDDATTTDWSATRRGLVALIWHAQNDIYIASTEDADTLDFEAWTADNRNDVPSSFTSTGSLLFTSDRNGHWQLFQRTSATDAVRAIDESEAVETWPTAITGSTLFWRMSNHEDTARRGQCSLMRRDERSNETRELLRSGMEVEISPEGDPPPLRTSFRCTPTGTCVLMERGEGIANFVHLDSETGTKGNELAFRLDARGIQDWSLSPDGEKVALVDGSARLRFVTLANGETETRTIANTPYIRNVTFAPEGRDLYVTTRQNGTWRLLRIEARTGRSETLIQGNEGNISRPVAGPQHIAIARRTDESDAWIIEGL